LTANKIGVFCEFAGPDGDLVLRPTGTGILSHTVGAATDWAVEVDIRGGGASATAVFGHGIPVIWMTGSQGGCTVTPGRPSQTVPAALPAHARLIAVDSARYLLLGRPGSRWTQSGGAHTTGSSEIAVGLLPDDRPETLALYVELAGNRVVSTQADMVYDRKQSAVRTTFRLRGTDPRKPVLQALYPHQWRHRSGNPTVRGTFMSSYGELRLDTVTSFETVIPFHGILPSLHHEPSLRPTLARLVEAEVPAELPRETKDTYWTGKDLGKWSALHRTALAVGKPDLAAKAADLVRRTLERWLTPSGPATDNAVFAYDREWSTLIGYPAGFGTDTDLNDHHFHYGYFIQAAAELARVDPVWVSPKRFGGMLEELVDDIACADRNHPRYPYLRCFDIYAGHSWASGNAPFASGNNQESSSEAINAWAGMAMLGVRTGNTALHDRGICLCATEVAALSEYWLDVHRSLPAAYPCPQVAMVWGGKRVHETWFSNRPEAIHAINWLPFTPASLYLGLHPDAAKRNHDALMAETGGDLKQWKDLIWMHQALHDPDNAIAAWKREAGTYEAEVGQSRAAAIEWIGFLRAYGTVDRTVRMDTFSYAVLRKNHVRTYVVWNPGKSGVVVRATDGQRFTVPPGGPHVFQRRV